MLNTPNSHKSKRNTHDTKGRPYAKLSELKAGDFLVPDGGFDCMSQGEPRRVHNDSTGALYVLCSGPDAKEAALDTDRHYLSGQADDGEHLVGLYRREDY